MKNQNANDKQRRTTPRSRAHSILLPRFTIECIERHELLLCGCRKVELYSEQKITICTHSSKVCICGEGLTISFLGDGRIKLSGTIDAIEFI